MRLFFAVCPDHETRNCIATAARSLALSEGSRLVPADNYHMTLAFAGDVPNSQAAVLRALGPIKVPAFAVRFDTYEHWPTSEVLVIAARESPAALQELHQMLRTELASQGLALDPKPFRPHVTIARKVAQPPVFQAMQRFIWRVSDFRLVRSVRSASDSVYTVLDRWPLLDKTSSIE